MSLARNTLKTVPPDKRRRVGGPRQANQDDLSDSGSQDLGYGSASEELVDDDGIPLQGTRILQQKQLLALQRLRAQQRNSASRLRWQLKLTPRAGRQREVQSD